MQSAWEETVRAVEALPPLVQALMVVGLAFVAGRAIEGGVRLARPLVLLLGVAIGAAIVFPAFEAFALDAMRELSRMLGERRA